MKVKTFIIILASIVLVNVLAQWCFFRIDLTEDKRYSLSSQTKTLLAEQEADIRVTVYLSGELNAGFLRLQNAVSETLDEMAIYGPVAYQIVNPLTWQDSIQYELQTLLAIQGLSPTSIYEKSKGGQQKQTLVYPFASVQIQDRQTFVALLQNNRGLSGAENLNHSIESLEYVFAETFRTLSKAEMPKVVFLEGHHELPEAQTADFQSVLSRYFDVYRGTITQEANCLDIFEAVIVADPQTPFSEQEKYILDQYIMRGGRVLWLVNGVQFSENILEESGYTPIIPLDLRLTDMFFRYGVRINPRLVQDLQCLRIPIDVSTNPQQPQYQPMPWTFAPLLLTSGASPITKNLMQVSATFPSDIDFVGDGANQHREVLLATASASALVSAPGEVNLGDLTIQEERFTKQLVPIAASIEGTFPSLFTHRMLPEGVIETRQALPSSVNTKQVWVACGSVASNDVQNGQPLPVGYDRYSRVQFGNRDFLVNTLLYLTDDDGLINLREKTIKLRLLNERKVAEANIGIIIALPLVLLALVAVGTLYIRKRKYTRQYVS